MTHSGYVVHYHCHLCGGTHLVNKELLIPGGPTETGSLDELYPDAELPASVARLLGDLVWCDQAADYIELEDPARVYLTPRVPGVAAEG